MKARRKKDDAFAGQWDRLLAAASSGLDFQVHPPIMATTQRRVFDREDFKDLKDLKELSQTDSEIVGILASIATSSTPRTAPSSSDSNAAHPVDTTPNFQLQVIQPRPQPRPQPRKPTAKPVAKSRRKTAATGGNPNNAKPTKNATMKQESKPRIVGPATAEQHVLASSDRTPKPQTPVYEDLFPISFRCCPVEVPDFLLALLDSPARPAAELMRQFAPFQRTLCFIHLQKFAQLMAAYAFEDKAISTISTAVCCSSQTGQNPTPGVLCAPQLSYPTTLPAEDNPPRKRQRVDGCETSYFDCVVSGNQHSHGPILDSARDEAFRQQVMRELEERILRAQAKSHGDVTDQLIYSILQNCTSPSPDEAYLLSGEEAAARVEAGPADCPIFTQGQQQFRWDRKDRPISEMFRRMEDMDRSVSVQIPSRKAHLQSFQKKKLSDVQKQFMESRDLETDDPWNVLDLRNPLPPAVLPKFLTGENCQLLPRVRDSVLSGSTAERTVAAKEQWNEWLDVLDWVLMSEGGHNTAPHMDSHGLSTWLTVQEGEFGYGWLSKPTKEERDAWIAHPQHFVGGRWRYTVLTPGQTVFFNSGTVHFVFRIRHGQTMALGGHVLQWSGLAHWASIIQDQLRNPQITNEDMEWSAPKYLRVVADLVESRIKTGRIDEMGGQEAVDKFIALVKVRIFSECSDREAKSSSGVREEQKASSQGS